MRLRPSSAVESIKDQPSLSGHYTPAQKGGCVHRARMMLDHYHYYVGVLRNLPYGAFRRVTRRKCRGYSVMEPFLVNKRGLEIGGPSLIFRGNKLIPVYDRCKQIDNCNFSSQTIWSRPVDDKRFGSHFGAQYVAEACDISVVPDGTYDFLLASHVLEHIANPLRALQEWGRTLTSSGGLLAIVPDRRGTFDHKRPFTSFDHILADFQGCTAESDLTHLNEVVERHDLRKDLPGCSQQQFRNRCQQNAIFRAMHHHVFSPEVLILMFTQLEMRVLTIAIERPYHIVLFAQKSDPSGREAVRLHNLSFLGEGADWRKDDPLRTLAEKVFAGSNHRGAVKKETV
jgi:hypothetical protein